MDCSNRQINTTKSFSVRRRGNCSIHYSLNNTSTSPLKISKAHSVAQRFQPGSKTWQAFIHFLFPLNSQQGRTDKFFQPQRYKMAPTAENVAANMPFPQFFSPPVSPDKVHLHLGRTHVYLKWGGRRDNRCNGSPPPWPFSGHVVNDDSSCSQGWRRTARAAASQHWLIEWERKARCQDRAWHGGTDKNIIAAAPAS